MTSSPADSSPTLSPQVTAQSVILSEAKNLFYAGQRPFAALRVTNRTERLPSQQKSHSLPRRLSEAVRHVDWAAVALAIVTFAAFLRTLAPSVLWSDEAEFQYSAYSLSIPHQTGYPLYILLAKLWTLLPIGDVAFRVNLMSACWGVVTVVLTYFCIKRLSGRRLPAAASALSLAFASAFWAQSSIAGVRTLHTAFVALITLLVIGLAQRQASVEALALAIGLSLTHHRMTIFLLPGIAWAVWETRSHVSWTVRRWIKLAALIAVPQALYLFVALGKSWSSSREFWDFVLTTNEAPNVLAKTSKQIAEQFMGQVLPSVWSAFTPIGLLIALVGLCALLLASRRSQSQWCMGGYLAIGWALNILFAGLHFTEDPNKYLTHGFVLQAVALGAGLAVTLGWLEHKLNWRSMGRRAGWIALALPAVLMATSWRAADQSGTGWIGPFTLDELAGVESNSLIVADWSSIMPYRYHQIVEGQRRDLTLVHNGDAQAMNRVEPDIKSGRPVYLRERYLGKQWKGQLSFIPVGRLWRVLPAEPTFDAPQQVDEPFGDDIRLTQIATWPANLTADRLMLLRLGWELSHPIEHSVSISVRLVGSDGETWQHQELPLQDPTGVLSTTAWLLGPGLPPGDYTWQISVDDHSTGNNLGLRDLPTFRIGRPDHPVPLSSIVVDGRPAAQPGLGGWELLGYASIVRNAQPGAFVTAPLYWRAARDVTGPAEAHLQLWDHQGQVIVEQNVTLPQQARAGDLFESRPGFELPVRLADGRYEFVITASASVSLGPLNVQGRTRSYSVPPIAHRRPVQLGQSIELLGYEINTDGPGGPVQPGSRIKLKLIWRAKNAPSQSLKVFIHVMDANGKLLTQKDGVPGNWSLPTDTWAAGEVIADSYEIPVPPEATSGDYKVQVGMYNPEDRQRLPALESGARLADDSIPLTTFSIP